MKLILASNNANKLREFRQLVEGLDIELLSQKEAGCDFEVDENGSTFEENAFLKASAVTKATGIAAVADDSGLCVDALNGEPGIYSARYGPGHTASDRERYEYLLKKLENAADRSARFVCCICCTFPDGRILTARGECEGEILTAPKGSNGFGYDPVFHPLCTDKGMAELSPAEKNAISHRGNALRAFIPLLREAVNGDNK